MWQLSDDNLVAAWQPLPRVTQLQDLNPFPRENRIEFREHDHKYFVDGALVPRSVTGLLHEYSADFDPSRALESMKHGRNWDAKRMEMEEQGLGTSDDEILARWNRNGAVQSRRGQLLHHHAECLMNGLAVEEPQSPEFTQINQIYHALLLQGLVPHRTELCIFHVGLRVAG